VRAAHAFVHHVLERTVEIEAHAHANLEEDIDNARVLTDRSMAFRPQPGVGEDLRDGVLRRGRLLALVGAAERADVVGRVVVRGELQRVGDALDEVGAPDQGHGGALQRSDLVILSARQSFQRLTEDPRRSRMEAMAEKKARRSTKAVPGDDVSEAQIAVHWQEEGYFAPPKEFVAQANLREKSVFK